MYSVWMHMNVYIFFTHKYACMCAHTHQYFMIAWSITEA